MSQYIQLKRLLRVLTHGRMRLGYEDDGGFYTIEDIDAPFCHRLDRITVYYSLSEVEQAIRHLT